MKTTIRVEIEVDDEHNACCSEKCPYWWETHGEDSDFGCNLFHEIEMDCSDILVGNRFKVFRCAECIKGDKI